MNSTDTLSTHLLHTAMPEDCPRQTFLDELDARQDELLSQLDELNARIECVLAECLGTQQDAELRLRPAA